MRTSDFGFILPTDLIAQQPRASREASRLLVLRGAGDGQDDERFENLPALLRPGDLLVFNDTRVVPARLHGRKSSGGAVELMLERVQSPRTALCQVRSSKPLRVGAEVTLRNGELVRVSARSGTFYRVEFARDAELVFAECGEIPLPPYIRRAPTVEDRERYQTVYARQPGAVAAPTAGLHFSRTLLERLAERGVEMTYLTLHVGAGTFAPVRDDDPQRHELHAEHLEVAESVVAVVNRARRQGRRIIAVGTTSVRALESAARDGELRCFSGDTALFIKPGFRFQLVDALITNFHLPESTLLMLVCALGGYERVMAAYRHAVQARYRFYSFGDAMLVPHRQAA